MRRPTPIAAAAAGIASVAAIAVAGTALAQPATINWQECFKSSAPENNPTVNVGEAVTWNVTEGGHNIDIYKGPETFKSTSGTDKSGTQFSHTFNKAGKYTFVCDYHSNMTGTVTVVDPAPQPGPQPQPQPKPGGGTPQPVTGGGAQTSQPGD